MAAFKHQDFLSRTRQIGSVDQAIVAAADDDYVVFGSVKTTHIAFRFSASAGIARIVAGAAWRFCCIQLRQTVTEALSRRNGKRYSRCLIRARREGRSSF